MQLTQPRAVLAGLVAAYRTRIKRRQTWRDGAKHTCSHHSFVSLHLPSDQTHRLQHEKAENATL